MSMFRFLSYQARRAYTLQELLISIAIVGILTAIVFTNFSKTKDINLLKTVSRQLQVDLQGAQVNAQGGMLVAGVAPNGFGIKFQQDVPNNTKYLVFADTSGNDGLYTAGSDTLLKTVNLPTNMITIVNLLADNAGNKNPANIFFSSLSNGKSIMDFNGTKCPSVTCTSTGRVRLRNSKLGICYDVVVTVNVGTVSENRKPSTCP